MSEDVLPEIHEQGSGNMIRTSELANAQKCMRRIGYSRYYGQSDVSETMLAGSAVDAALTEHNNLKRLGKQGLVGTALVDYAVTAFREMKAEARREGRLGGNPDPDAEFDMARVLPEYERVIDPHVIPVDTQEALSYKDPETGLILVGHRDLKRYAASADAVDGQEGHEITSDYKFTKKSKNQMPASTSQQLHSYDLMDGDDVHHVELILLRRLKTPKIETTSHFVTKTDHSMVIRALRYVGHMIKSYLWPPTDPSNWWCSPSWCGHWTLCRGKEDGPSPLPGEEGWEDRNE